MRPIVEFIKNPNELTQALLRHLGTWLPDSVYLKWMFRLKMGKRLNLKNPQTFCEKLQWLKLYNRQPEYTMMVDKLKVKQYVADRIGDEYVIPVLGVWDKPEDIDFDLLPNRFVLKTSHGGGGVGIFICKDKNTIDCKKAIETMRESMKQDIYKTSVEWPYKNVPKRIFAEQYMEERPDVKDLPVYKWYCFNGEPKYCQVIIDGHTKETIDFFDADWNHQEFVGLNPTADKSIVFPERPINLETHLHIARELSKSMPFSRIDLYEIKEKTYFGEITLYPVSGLGMFSPDQYNEILGAMLKLPGVNKGGLIINELHDNELRIQPLELKDYKLLCFGGEPKYVEVDSGRFGDHIRNIYDTEWNLQPIAIGYKNDLSVHFEKPIHLNEMIEFARLFSKGIPFLRVDFYEVNSRLYFGELTFFQRSGMTSFYPAELDVELGKLVELPQ